MLPIHRTKVSVFNYDEIPAGYYYRAMLLGSPIQRFWHRQKFRAIARRIGERDAVLDVGCGPGSFLSILGEEKKEVRAIGVDIASGQIDFATGEIGSRFPDGRIRFVSLKENDFTLPFPDKSFDVITSIEVIEHLHPHIAFQILNEAKRVLKDDGRIIVSTPNYRSLWPVLELILEKLSPVKYHDQHISKFTPNSLVKFLEVVGLEVKSLSTIFVAAPFLTLVSRKVAEWAMLFEQKLDLRLGHLLIAEAGKLQWPSPSVGTEMKNRHPDSQKKGDSKNQSNLPTVDLL